MRMITRPALAGALALVLTVPAAAGTLGTIPIDPNGAVFGTFTGPGTQTWRLYLEQGKDYAIDGLGQCSSSAAVRAAGAKTLATFRFSDDDQLVGEEGVSLRAPYTGLYAVAVTVAAADFESCSPSGRYQLRAARDCRADASTRCAIAVGQTLQNLHLDYLNDADWFRTTLAAGHAYQMTVIEADYYCADLAFLDAVGRPLAEAECASGQPLIFTAPASGAFFLAVKANDPPMPYSLSLVPAR